MKHVKRILTTPLHLFFAGAPLPAEDVLGRVKLQKRCVGLSRREKDFVQAQLGKATHPMLKELFLCNARGSIFSRPGTTTYAVYH